MPKWGRQRPRRLVFAVGLYTIGAGIYDMAYPAVTQNIREKVNLKERYGAGTWVVITGATNDLGREFANHFNSQGFNLVLVDSDQEQLAQVREKTLAQSFSPDAQVQTVAFDLKRSSHWQDYEALAASIKDLTKGGTSILVNNAEEFDPHGPKIHRQKDEDVLGTLTINTFPMVFMTRFLGPDLKQRSGEQAKSAIINLTSYYSTFNVTNAPIYSSAKSFEDVFSQILGYENSDIDVLTVKNMPFKSSQHPNGVPAKEIVEGVMSDLGQERISYGHWKHAALRYWILWRQCQWWFQPQSGCQQGGGSCPMSKFKFW